MYRRASRPASSITGELGCDRARADRLVARSSHRNPLWCADSTLRRVSPIGGAHGRAKKSAGRRRMPTRRQLAVLTSLALLSIAAPAAAQTFDDFPNRPIRIIVPQAAGSGVDLQARVLAQKVGTFWSQQPVVENIPGANAIIGMQAAARAKADGYTLVYAPITSVTTNAFIYKK